MNKNILNENKSKKEKRKLSDNFSFSENTLPRAFGIGGECVCPNCGHRFSFVPGQPCVMTVCTNCGKMMIRKSDNG